MDLQVIKGLGPKTIKALNEYGITSPEELIEFYPYRYELILPSVLDNTDENTTLTINATVVTTGTISYIKKNFNVLRFKATTFGKIINVSIFNRAYLKRNLIVGKDITIIGKYNNRLNSFTASNIFLSKVEKEAIIPIYHKINGLNNTTLNKEIKSALQVIPIKEITPSKYNNKYNLITRVSALEKIHNPCSSEDITIAKRKLIYDELFIFMFKIAYLKSLKEKEHGLPKHIDNSKIKDFINDLPFTLTSDQLSVINDSLKDLESPKRMNRLLIGDVGSGKTIVATTLIYASYLAGFASAFLVPTEILAIQHYQSITKLFKKYNITVELLIGNMTKKEKTSVIKRVNNGEISVLIGTHAILNEDLAFPSLGLVITDEQHRFGVNQREFLGSKKENVDMLFMSATPIPRTYALTIYGDITCSLIKEKPAGRKEIITKIYKESALKEVLLKVLEEIKASHQVYVVSPMINEMEENDLKDVYLLEEKFNLAFHGKVPIGVLHGKLKKTEKDKVMHDFKNGNTKILISTTVIEVGVDVPMATMMIIFNAERFGLATLHQLRGRVGRSDLQSYCYLICNKEIARLKVLEESNDGFYISEKDFEFRGEGDLFGSKQSGDMTFKIANLKRDYNILLAAKKDSLEYIKNKEYLSNEIFCKILKEINITN